jgi:hypothetical protein
MTLTVGVALLVVLAVVVALAARVLRPPASDAVAVEPRAVQEIATMPGDVSPSPELLVPELPQAESAEPALPEPEPEPGITWTAALTVTALDGAARLRLIDDLALLAAPWTIALLRRAYQEESSPQLRARIEAALASSGEPIDTTS